MFNSLSILRIPPRVSIPSPLLGAWLFGVCIATCSIACTVESEGDSKLDSGDLSDNDDSDGADSKNNDDPDPSDSDDWDSDGSECSQSEAPPPFQGRDRRDPSAKPPCGLDSDEVPQFVSIGFDDNGYSGLDGSNGTGAMAWILDVLAARQNPGSRQQGTRIGTFDGHSISASFYHTSTYVGTWLSESPAYVKQAWRRAVELGQEVGNHTHSHGHGSLFDQEHWDEEVQTCLDWLTKPWDPDEIPHSPNDASGIGVPRAQIFGFRTPYLEYNDAMLSVVQEKGFWYDCSIEDGWQYDQDGTNYLWPYTLDRGSPGHDVLVEWGLKEPLEAHPGLWELPVHPVLVPPDDECEAYGVKPGLRAKYHELFDWFDVESGKITGFDYNLWVQFKTTKAEFLAILKYTLDQRLAGNRAPFMFGAHTDYYSSKYTAPPNATTRERQEAIEEFIDYALSKPEVRFVSNKQILDWVRFPVALSRGEQN